MHGNTTSVWPGTSTTAITTSVLVRTEGSNKFREVLWATLQHRERGDAGIPGVLNTVYYHSKLSRYGNLSGDLWTPGGSTLFRMVNGETKHIIV